MRLFVPLAVFSAVALLGVTTASAVQLPSRAVVFDCPESAAKVQANWRVLGPEEAAALGSAGFAGDTLRLLVVAVEWLNTPARPSTYPVDTFEQVFFSRDYLPGGSVADYFHEVSYGDLTITGDVYGWVNAGTYIANSEQLLSVLTALDPTIDYTQYDGDGDGMVDGVAFVIAGTGLQDTGCDTDI